MVDSAISNNPYPVLAQYRKTVANFLYRGSRVTIKQFANQLDNTDVIELLNQLGSRVSTRYINRASIVGQPSPFHTFLLDCCCEDKDTLQIPAYQNSGSKEARQNAVRVWLNELQQAGKKRNTSEGPEKPMLPNTHKPTSNPILIKQESSNECTEHCQDAAEFMKLYNEVKKSIPMTNVINTCNNIVVTQPTGIKSLNSGNTRTQVETNQKEPLKGSLIPTSKIIVNQKKYVSSNAEKHVLIPDLPKKPLQKQHTETIVNAVIPTDSPKRKYTVAKEAETSYRQATTEVAAVINIMLVKAAKYPFDIPRNMLEPLIDHVETAIKTGNTTDIDGMSFKEIRSNLFNAVHNGFDASNSEQLGNALCMIEENISTSPRRECREVVDLLERGFPKIKESLRSCFPTAMDFAIANKQKISSRADKDLLLYAPDIADAIIKSEGNNTLQPQNYVIAHNDTQILRYLLNSNIPKSVAKFMKNFRISEHPSPTGVYSIFSTNGQWDFSLSSSNPYIDPTGNIKIFASKPFLDAISYFTSWTKDNSLLNNESVWLAPTDETILVASTQQSWPSIDKTAQKEWLEKHRVLDKDGSIYKYLKNSSKETPRPDTFSTIHGKKVEMIIASTIIKDSKNKAVFVPITTIL